MKTGRPHSLTPEQRKEITDIWDKKESVKTLAQKYNVTENVIKGILYKHNKVKHGK